LAVLNSLQIRGFETADLRVLTSIQLNALSTLQISALTTSQMLGLNTQQISGWSSEQADAYVSPLILDLNRDGVQTLSALDGVSFDIRNDGNPVQSGWVAPSDGLLVRDLNHDGVINDGGELFGQGTVLSNQTKANNGFIALAELDSNLDGLIDKNDQAFSELGIWQDVDSNGVTDAGELHTLSELGVKSLSLQHAETTIINQGNLIGLMGSFQTEDGKIHELADIWFKTEALKNAYLASEVNPSELIDIISASNLVFEELVVECNPELLSDITNESNVSQNSSLNSVDVNFVSADTMASYDVHVTDNSKPIMHDQIRPLI